MSTLREAAQQALEALEQVRAANVQRLTLTEHYHATIAALRAALAQQETIIRGLHSISNEDNGVLTLCFADESSAEAFMVSHAGDADEALIQRAALAQQEQADYPEEKLQAVAEYISDKYHVWYGVAARDIEEVLRQSVSCGLVSNPPRREWQGLTDDEISALFPSSLRSDYKPYSFARAIEQACKERNT